MDGQTLANSAPNTEPNRGALLGRLCSEIGKAFTVEELSEQLAHNFVDAIQGINLKAPLSTIANNSLQYFERLGLLLPLLTALRQARPDNVAFCRACDDFAHVELIQFLGKSLGSDESEWRTPETTHLYSRCRPATASFPLSLGPKHPTEYARDLLRYGPDPHTKVLPVLAFGRGLQTHASERYDEFVASTLGRWCSYAQEYLALRWRYSVDEVRDGVACEAHCGNGTDRCVLVCALTDEETSGKQYALHSWLHTAQNGRRLDTHHVLKTGAPFLEDLGLALFDVLDEVTAHDPLPDLIEFFVPAALRHSAIDRCPLPRPLGGSTRPLGVAYPVVLRCADRARKPQARAALGRRVDALEHGVAYPFELPQTDQALNHITCNFEVSCVAIRGAIPEQPERDVNAFFLGRQT